MTQHRDTIGRQVGEQPGEQLVKDLRPARQQPVGMPALGHPLAGQPDSGSGSRSTIVTRRYESASTRAASSPPMLAPTTTA